MFCNKCQTEKLPEEFYRDNTRPGKRRTPCKACFKKDWGIWKVANPEKARRKILRQAIELRYPGFSVEEFDRMVLAQGGVCRICSRTCDSKSRLSIDHNHQTGKIRGLLCANCNHGLGHFKDSPDLLRSAIEYLAAASILTEK